MRGPYEGTWQQGIRPTIVTAPDALVYINGETEILGCPTCRRRFDLNKYITSIQVDLNVDSAPGTASVNLSIPRHSLDEFYFDGNPMITPMMEVEIFAKGYFLVEGLPQYYPIFWGMVTEVSDSYSGGEHSFSINCADILKWWELCKMNINPAFTQASGQLGRSIFGNVLFGSNPYDMIWSLAQQAFGDVVVGSGSLVSLWKEGQQRQTFNSALGDIMQYWQQRFSKIRSNLLLYGTQGNAVRGDVLYQTYQKQGGDRKFKASRPVPFASQNVRQANGGDSGSQMVFDPTSAQVTAFRTQFSQAGQVNFWTSEFQTKLEIANACKEAIGFEFYMDVTGDIVFKPPFYNLDILSNKPVSWIQDIDIIDWDLSESEAEVVTQVQLQGSFGGNVEFGFGEEATPGTSVTDYHLLRKYGWRAQTFNSEFSGSPLQMFYIGMDLLDRYNSRRFRGTVNIPLRPELRLGFPIYLAPKDQVWYLTGISHNIQFGGRAQTTLTLSAKRCKFLAPQGIGTIELTGYKGEKDKQATPKDKLDPKTLTTQKLAQGGQFKAIVGDAAQIPPINYPDSPGTYNPYEPLVMRHPKTGRLVGYPNVVMAYTRPFADPSKKQVAKLSGKKDPNAARAVPKTRDQTNAEVTQRVSDVEAEAHKLSSDDKLREKYLNNRYQYGLNSAGVYTYLYDKSSVVKEILLLPAQNISFDEATNSMKIAGTTGMIRPVSDERGFEIIGHFRYGRGVSLRDGSLVLNVTGKDPNAENTRAEINLQLALSGTLTETLQAQSAGLTTSSTLTSNPASTLAAMQPDDPQTAGIINPATKEPEFVNVGENFVNTAPLGTPQQQGTTNSTSEVSVEASQLSRALTLAEMAVKEEAPTSECSCLLGRSDLAFIGVGYQIKVMTPSADADGTIRFGSMTADQTSQISAYSGSVDLLQQQQAAVDAAEQEAQRVNNTDPLADIDSEAFAEVADNRIVSARTKALADFQAAHAEEFANFTSEGESALLSEALEGDGKPVTGMALSYTQTVSKVEAFLAQLYTALDTSHTEYERGLRGEYVNVPQVNADDVRFAEPEDLGGVSPPFGPAGRAVGGDPAALSAQANDSLNEAVSVWNDLAGSVEADVKRGLLEQEIAELTQQVAALSAEVSQAEQAGIPVDPGLRAALDIAMQALANKQQELNNLNQEYPPA